MNIKETLSSILGTGSKVGDEVAGSTRGYIRNSLTSGGGNRQYERSLRGRSDNFTLQFPIVVSNSLNTDSVEVIRNQVELERSADLCNVITNTPVLNVTGSAGYLNQYHNNVYMGNKSIINTANESAEAFAETNEKLMADPDEDLEKKSLNTQTLPKELVEADDSSDEVIRRPEPSAKVLKADRLNRSIPLMTRISNVNYAVRDMKDPKKIVEVINKKELVFGVKAVVHTVDHEDVVYFLGESSTRSNILARLIKLTTGELSFFKEFLFNIDRSKKIATSKHSGVWATMNSMFTDEKMSQYQKKQGLIPTISLVVSAEEVEQVRINTGIDILTNSRAAAKIYDELYLLDFYVIDETNQLAHKYLPRERKFDTYTLSSMSGSDLNDRNKTKNTAEDLLKRLLGNR